MRVSGNNTHVEAEHLEFQGDVDVVEEAGKAKVTVNAGGGSQTIAEILAADPDAAGNDLLNASTVEASVLQGPSGGSLTIAFGGGGFTGATGSFNTGSGSIDLEGGAIDNCWRLDVQDGIDLDGDPFARCANLDELTATVGDLILAMKAAGCGLMVPDA